MNTPQLPTCPKCGLPLPVDAPKGLCPRCLAAMNLADETAFTGADAVAAQTPLTPSELAPHFPQLEILECLGRGGMGVVYKARQKSLNRFVALKLLAPERAKDPDFADRFVKEAQALAALNHPHIVGVYDFGEAGGFYFLLMEFVDGVNLRQAMKAGRFTPEQALAVVPPVCEALQFAHEHGIVHRDIKPENLLLDKDGRVKIADFGIAKMLGAAAYQPPTDAAPAPGTAADKPPLPENDTHASAAGTPQYMAPEQKAHRRTDHRADIYSLGVVLYELLTGELPADKLQPPSRKVQIDVRLDEIVLRALETKPELRYQTAGEMRTQVETFTSSPRSSRGHEAPSEGKDQSLLTSAATGPRFLKVGTSTLATPEQLATFAGQFFCFRARGQLILDERQLTHSRAGTNTVIPLAAIRDLSVGKVPRTVNPAGLDLISVTFEEGGQSRRLLLSPMQGWFALPGSFNAHVTEWFRAIRDAATIASGTAPTCTPADQLGIPRGSRWPLLAICGVPLLASAALIALLVARSNDGSSTFAGKAFLLVCALLPVLAVWSFTGWLRPVAAGESTDGITCGGRRKRWQGWDAWVIGLCLATFGALWLLQLTDERLLHRPLYDGAGAGSSVVLPIALATTILLAGAAFLWMLAKNIGTPASRAASSKRILGRTIVPVIALVVLLRTFFVQSFEAATDAAAPEIPRGSYMLTWKLAREFAPGDVIVYRHENRPNVGRVTRSEPAAVIVERNGSADFRVPRQNITGKVISVFWRASAPSGVTQFDIVPVGVSNNVVIVDVTTEVKRGKTELRAVLDGPQLPATTEADLAGKFSPPFTGTFVKPMQDWAKQPSRSLSPGRQTWRLGFVLPDAALAKAAFEDIRPIGALPAMADRTAAGTLFMVRDPNREEFHASLHVSLPISPANPNWVSVSSALSVPGASALSSYNETGGVIMKWEVLASQPGIVALHREDGQSTASLRRDPKTKLYQTTVSLELTQAGNDRVLLVSRIGGTTAREELTGNLRELSAELWSYKNLSATTVRGTEIELCRFQGKPISVLVPVLISTVAPSATATSPAIQRVEISQDKAVVHTAQYDGSGLLITLGTGTNRWTPSGRYLDGLFNVTLEWPRFRSGALHVIQPRHGIHMNYRLDGPPGPMVGKLVFHPGVALPDAGGSCVIGEFQPDTGEPLPIAVEFVPDQATPPHSASAHTPATSKSYPATVKVVSWAFPFYGIIGLCVIGGVVAVLLMRKGWSLGKVLLLLGGLLLVAGIVIGGLFLVWGVRGGGMPVPSGMRIILVGLVGLFIVLGAVALLVLLVRKGGTAGKVVALVVAVPFLLLVLAVAVLFGSYKVARDFGPGVGLERLSRTGQMVLESSYPVPPQQHPPGEVQQTQNGFRLTLPPSRLASFEFFIRQADDTWQPVPSLTALVATGEGGRYWDFLWWTLRRDNGTHGTNQLWFWSVGANQSGGHPMPQLTDHGTNFSHHVPHSETLDWWQLAVPPRVEMTPGTRQTLTLFRTFGTATARGGQPKEARIVIRCEPLPAGLPVSAGQHLVQAGLAAHALLEKTLPAANAAMTVPPHIEFKVLRVENPPGTRTLLVHFERDANHGLGLEAWQAVRGDRVPAFPVDVLQRTQWVGSRETRTLNWTLPTPFTADDARRAAAQLEKDLFAQRDAYKKLFADSAPILGEVRHPDGWSFQLLLRVKREEVAP